MAETLYFTRTYAVGMLHFDADYLTAHNAEACSNLSVNPVAALYVQHYVGFYIFRTALHFNTALLPDDAIITEVKLKIKQVNTTTTNVIGMIRNGQPTYPHNPAVAGDYLYSHYSGDGGQFGPYSSDGYKLITFTEEGRGWINKEGVTKIVLMCKTDVDAIEPSGYERAAWFYNDYSQAAQLQVTYEEAAYDYPLAPVVFPTQLKKGIDTLKQKCVNFEESMSDVCLVFNHNVNVTREYLQLTYGDTTYPESSNLRYVLPSQQLVKLSNEEVDYYAIINNFITNISSMFTLINENNMLVKTWLDDYMPDEEGHDFTDVKMLPIVIDKDMNEEQLSKVMDSLFEAIEDNVITLNDNLEILKERF